MLHFVLPWLKIMFFFVIVVLLVMFNKAALSSYNFPCANVITLLQVCYFAFLSVFLFYIQCLVLDYMLYVIGVDELFDMFCVIFGHYNL